MSESTDRAGWLRHEIVKAIRDFGGDVPDTLGLGKCAGKDQA